MIKKSFKLIYLDHAATTPVDPGVLKAMQPYWSHEFGNPSSLYRIGKQNAAAIQQARKAVADILHCNSKEIIFNAGGTESINLAIFGVARAYQLKHKKPGHIITTPIEHHAVLNSVAALKQEGWSVSYAPVDNQGFVDLKKIKSLVKKDTVLVSVMYANNEIGTIEPIAEIGKWLHGLNQQRTKTGLSAIYFHTDACQASGSLELDVNKLHVDLMSLNGSKIYGPKQTGILYAKRGVALQPIIFGGGQESDLRSGTENVPGIVGFATALALAQKERLKENKRLLTLRNFFIDRLFKKVKGLRLNGLDDRNGLLRLPNNVNITFPNIEGEALMLYLDSHNIAVSTGSACATTSTDPSHVLIAIGVPRKEAYNAVRFTLGKATTKQQLNYVLTVLPQLISMLGKVSKP